MGIFDLTAKPDITETRTTRYNRQLEMGAEFQTFGVDQAGYERWVLVQVDFSEVIRTRRDAVNEFRNSLEQARRGGCRKTAASSPAEAGRNLPPSETSALVIELRRDNEVMADLILSMLPHLAYLGWTLLQVVVMARKKEAVFVILYFLPLLCVESARDIAVGNGMQWWLGEKLNFAVFLGSVLVLNAYLVSILGWLEFGEIGRRAIRSRKLAVTMIVGLILSYVYLFEGIGLRDTLTTSETHRFTDALYFVVATFTTVGYGDVIPKDHVGRAFAGLASLNAYLVLAIVVSTMLPRFLKQQGLRVEIEKPGPPQNLS